MGDMNRRRDIGFFLNAEDGIQDPLWSRGLGNVFRGHPHKYHPNRSNRKKGPFGQSGAYPKSDLFFFFENFLY